MHEHNGASCSFAGLFTYTSASGAVGRCYLMVCQRTASLPVVIAYEVASNPGPSVTNAVASLATQVWRQVLPNAREGIIVVEAYADPHPSQGAPTARFAEVTFDLDGDALHTPRWRHIERADVEWLIGGSVSLPAETS